MNRFVLEVGHLNAVGTGQLEDLVARAMRGRSDPLRTSPRRFELREKLFRPADFVL
jgi:hypothetical protein